MLSVQSSHAAPAVGLENHSVIQNSSKQGFRNKWWRHLWRTASLLTCEDRMDVDEPSIPPWMDDIWQCLCLKYNRKDKSATAISSLSQQWWPIAPLPQRPRMQGRFPSSTSRSNARAARPTTLSFTGAFLHDATPGLATPFHATLGLPHLQATRTPVPDSPPSFAQNASYT